MDRNHASQKADTFCGYIKRKEQRRDILLVGRLVDVLVAALDFEGCLQVDYRSQRIFEFFSSYKIHFYP